MITVGLASIT